MSWVELYSTELVKFVGYSIRSIIDFLQRLIYHVQGVEGWLGQGDDGRASHSGFFELWGSREEGGRIGQRLDNRFHLMICYNAMQIYLKFIPSSIVLELKG